MSELYDQYHDEDGFLYINYSAENTLGSCDRPLNVPSHYKKVSVHISLNGTGELSGSFNPYPKYIEPTCQR